MIRMSCERCGKRYVLKDPPATAPGRSYRLTCKVCGHTVVLKGAELAAARAGSTSPTSSSPPAPEHPQATVLPIEPPAPASSELQHPQATDLPSLGLPLTPPAAPLEPEPVVEEVSPAPSAPSSSARAEPRYIDLFSDVDLPEPGAAKGPPAPTPPAPARAPSSPLTPTPRPLPVTVSAKPEVVPAMALRPGPTTASRPSEPPTARRPDRSLILATGSILGAFLLAVVGIAFWRGLAQRSDRPAPPSAQEPAAPPTPAAPPPPTAEAPAPAPATPEAPAAPSPAPSAASPADTVAVAPTPPPEPPAAETRPAPSSPARPSPAKPPARPAKPPPPPPKHTPARTDARAAATAPAGAPATAAAAEAPATSPAATPAAPDEPPPPDTLRPDQIQRGIASGRKAFDACLKDPSRGASEQLGPRVVTLRLMVGSDGSVSYPTIDDVTVSSAPVGQCLKTAARALQFPAFGGDPIKVDVPIQIPAR